MESFQTLENNIDGISNGKVKTVRTGLFHRKQYIYQASPDDTHKRRLKHHTLMFMPEKSSLLMQLYDLDDFKDMSKISCGTSYNMLLELLGNDEAEVYYSQIMKFVRDRYVPITKGKEHCGNIAKDIKTLIAVKA